MKYIAKFLHNPTEFIKDERTQKILILSVFIVVFVCLLILLVRGASRRSEAVADNSNVATMSVSMTRTITPTKWWIKNTTTASPIPSRLPTASAPAGSQTRNCTVRFSSPLKPGIYAYISLAPPLPNRLRSGAGLSNTYLGQIDPGDGLTIIDGPICADGYSWWLVESVHGSLRGWTAEGKGSQQWILPCPNESVACNQKAVPTSLIIDSNKEKNSVKSNCKSDKLAMGIITEVAQDSLLVVRSDPARGDVIGRAGPTSVVKIVDGPTCAGGALWWKVKVIDLGFVGWATESNLNACPKDSECNLELP